MNKYISIVIVVLVIGLGVWLFIMGKNKEDTLTDSDIVAETQTLQTDQAINEENITNINSTNNNKKIMNATLKTNMGEIKIEFFVEDAPKTVDNFIKLANSKFYDGVKFHRVIKGFMIQGGDPNSKDDSKTALWGQGGPGYKFPDEIDIKSDLYTKMGYKKGVVAMANSGPNTNGSQFFIMHADYPLPPLYTIFGKVVSGQDVVDKIALVKTGPNDRPIEAVVINSVTVN